MLTALLAPGIVEVLLNWEFSLPASVAVLVPHELYEKLSCVTRPQMSRKVLAAVSVRDGAIVIKYD